MTRVRFPTVHVTASVLYDTWCERTNTDNGNAKKRAFLQLGSTKEVFDKNCTVKVVLQARARKGSDNWETSMTQSIALRARMPSICSNYSIWNHAKMCFFVWQTKSNPSAELRSILAEFTI